MAVVSLGPELGIIVRTPEKVPVLKKEFAVCDILRKRLPAGAAPPEQGWMKAAVLGIEVDIVPFVYRTEDEAAGAMVKLIAEFKAIGLSVDVVAGKVAEE